MPLSVLARCVQGLCTGSPLRDPFSFVLLENEELFFPPGVVLKHQQLPGTLMGMGTHQLHASPWTGNSDPESPVLAQVLCPPAFLHCLTFPS